MVPCIAWRSNGELCVHSFYALCLTAAHGECSRHCQLLPRCTVRVELMACQAGSKPTSILILYHGEGSVETLGVPGYLKVFGRLYDALIFKKLDSFLKCSSPFTRYVRYPTKLKPTTRLLTIHFDGTSLFRIPCVYLLREATFGWERS